jgi:ATP-dependent DNA helicase RecG
MSLDRHPLDRSVQFVKGVGPRMAELFAKVGVHSVRDLFYHFPRRYEDRSEFPPIGSVRPGQWVTVRGRLLELDTRPTRGGMAIIKATLTDGSGMVTLVWFNQPWVRRALTKFEGEILAYGQVKEANWGIEIHSPEWELVEPGEESDQFGRIIPVYPLAEGLQQRWVRRAVETVLATDLEHFVDPLTPAILKRQMLRPLRWSLRQIHRPESEEFRQQARERLVFEELFYPQIAMEIAGLFPFQLTRAQRRVIDEIFADMRRPHPMNRLIQGDVGSGKTAVAAAAMLAAVRSGYQAALMAPTEILAEQHYIGLHRIFEAVGIRVALIVGKQNSRQRKAALESVVSGQAMVAVGTHALIQEGVEFARLGLAIVDEQHRFGVMQRLALRQKGDLEPDVLVMTATPIPRTLTLAFYGHLDVSVIDELPPGRQAIKTYWKLPYERPKVYEGVRTVIAEGKQAYFVCPMISESEKMQTQAAEDLYYRLSKDVYPDLRVGLLHGQMKADAKEEVMLAFRSGELDILVSTMVIEVGVDVPNAIAMVIEDANRFGLAQLHQLRGRVGRSSDQSYCVLVAEAKSEEARARLETMVSTTDGFKIAEQDLRLRGPGQLMGTLQHGNLDLKIADLVKDARIIEVARECAEWLLQSDLHLERPEHQAILAKVQEHPVDKTLLTVS